MKAVRGYEEMVAVWSSTFARPSKVLYVCCGPGCSFAPPVFCGPWASMKISCTFINCYVQGPFVSCVIVQLLRSIGCRSRRTWEMLLPLCPLGLPQLLWLSRHSLCLLPSQLSHQETQTLPFGLSHSHHHHPQFPSLIQWPFSWLSFAFTTSLLSAPKTLSYIEIQIPSGPFPTPIPCLCPSHHHTQSVDPVVQPEASFSLITIFSLDSPFPKIPAPYQAYNRKQIPLIHLLVISTRQCCLFHHPQGALICDSIEVNFHLIEACPRELISTQSWCTVHLCPNNQRHW